MAQDKGRGNLIKEQLKSKGYTQVWLAEQLGVSFSITNAYACNRKQPNLKTIFKIVDLLGVSPKDLVF